MSSQGYKGKELFLRSGYGCPLSFWKQQQTELCFQGEMELYFKHSKAQTYKGEK